LIDLIDCNDCDLSIWHNRRPSNWLQLLSVRGTEKEMRVFAIALALTLSDRGLQLFFKEHEFFVGVATMDPLFGGTV